jgi:hypothetical protein
MVDYKATADAIREGEAVARARHQAAIEMEEALVAQEQALEAGTGVPIVEQADGLDVDGEEGTDVVTAGQGSGSAMQGEDGSGTGIVDPGSGTDPSETATSHGEPAAPHEAGVELEGDERTFEGEGRHSLADQ